jgi:hypothetical protein
MAKALRREHCKELGGDYFKKLYSLVPAGLEMQFKKYLSRNLFAYLISTDYAASYHIRQLSSTPSKVLKFPYNSLVVSIVHESQTFIIETLQISVVGIGSTICVNVKLILLLI